MSNTTILQLPVAIGITGAEYTDIVQSGTTKRVQLTLISQGPAASSQSANTIYAGPTSGAAAGPSFRSMVIADLPGTPTAISGGIPYFSSTAAVGSSALLTQYGLMVGGGAGAAPSALSDVGTTTKVLHGNASGNPTWSAVSLTADVTGTLPAANGGTGITSLGTGVATALGVAVNGSGAISLTTSPTFVTPILGTPTSGTLTNCTGLPVSTGIAGLGTGIATALGVAVNGSGAISLTTSPTFVTPTLGVATATRVGIGVSPSSQSLLINANGISEPQLEVYADDGLVQANITATTYGITGGGIFHGNFARGTKASPSGALAGDITGGIGSRPYLSSGAFAVSSPASIHYVASEDQTGTAHGMYLRFLTTPKGSIQRQERVIIADNGMLWAHDTTSFNALSDAQSSVLDSTANVRIQASGTTNAGIAAVAYAGGGGFRGAGAGAGATPALPTASTVGQLLCFMGGHGYDGTAWSVGTKALLAFKAAETWGASANGTYITIETTPIGSTTRAERVRVADNGFVTVTGAFGLGTPITKTADFTLAETENYIINNKSGSACVATLPAASSWTGRRVVMKTIQAQAINSASSDVVPVAGGAAGTAIVSGTAGKWAELVSDGTNWVIMAAG